MEFQFILIPIDPPTSTHQSALRPMRKRNGQMFIGKYKKSEAVQWEERFITLLKAEVAERKMKPISKPVTLHIHLCYKPPASRAGKVAVVTAKTTKPDLDNLLKIPIDCMVKAGLLANDQTVAKIVAFKTEWDDGGFIDIGICEAATFNLRA